MFSYIHTHLAGVLREYMYHSGFGSDNFHSWLPYARTSEHGKSQLLTIKKQNLFWYIST